MAMPQRDDTIEAIKRLDALLEYAACMVTRLGPNVSAKNRASRQNRFNKGRAKLCPCPKWPKRLACLLQECARCWIN